LQELAGVRRLLADEDLMFLDGGEIDLGRILRGKKGDEGVDWTSAARSLRRSVKSCSIAIPMLTLPVESSSAMVETSPILTPDFLTGEPLLRPLAVGKTTVNDCVCLK
jgi:hypothetical protein